MADSAPSSLLVVGVVGLAATAVALSRVYLLAESGPVAVAGLFVAALVAVTALVAAATTR